MKKLLLLTILLLLASCGSQDHRIKTGLQDNNRTSGYKQDSKIQIGLHDNKKIKNNKDQKLKEKDITCDNKKDNLGLCNKNTNLSSSEISKELDEEFSHIYSPNDSNHYENSCYLLLDIDYKNKQFVLYRNKGAGVGTGGCRLSGVEKIGVMWYHNGKTDPDGEYILKSYNKKTGLFKYVMSEKYGNLGTGNNEYEFRFYLTSGKVVKERIDKEISSSEFNKYGVYQILKEKCGVEDFDMSKIPTESGESVNLFCEDGDGILRYKGNNEYILSIEGCRIPLYYIYIKNGKITNEGYNICGKWFKTLDDFYNLSGEVAIGNLLDNDCKFIDITSGFKESGYYIGGKFVTINNKNELTNLGCSIFKVDNLDYGVDNVNGDNVILGLILKCVALIQ